ncbi:MAG: hypothetical protein U0807_06860 [Candidatus Binatia bacterium]
MRHLAAALLLAAGCGASPPEPESPGAVVLQQRCGGCHPVYAPGSMTIAMWEVKLEAMRRLFAQQQIPWLTEDEERTLVAYLRRHAGEQ